MLLVLVAFFLAQPALFSISRAASISPSVQSPTYISVGDGQTLNVHAFIDNSNSIQNWTIFQVASSSTGSNKVNVSIEWMSTILKSVPARSNYTSVLIHVQVAKDAPIGMYVSHIIIKLRTAIIPPYLSLTIPFNVVVQVRGQPQVSITVEWLDFSTVFLVISALTTSTLLIIYINKTIINA